MNLTEVSFGSAVPIDGYGPDFFRIGGRVLKGAVLVTATGASLWTGDEAALAALSGQVDVVLYGAGARIAPVPASLRAVAEAAGIGIEPMSSPSACRTYNVLLGEGRRVAALLLPVGAE